MYLLDILKQDHNKDYIVQFPDSSPLVTGSQLSRGWIQKLPTLEKNHRFSFKETDTNVPQPHLWYSNEEAIKALKLFLIAGNDLVGSLTYR